MSESRPTTSPVHESVDGRAVRAFGCFTDELEEMAAWLESCAVEVVAMEATGVYWIPVYEVLDRAGFEVHLVDARATKQVSGRKSDVRDCQWIRELMSYGLLRGAFRRGMRTVWCAPMFVNAVVWSATGRDACSTCKKR